MQRKNGTSLYSKRAPHNSPLNQFICSSHWLWVVWLYLVHAGIKKKRGKKEKSLFMLKVVQAWSVGQFFNVQIIFWTFVYPCSYLFTCVLALVTRNHGPSLYKPRHATAQLFYSSAMCFRFFLFLQVAYCTLSSLSFHYLWIAAVIYTNEIIVFALLAAYWVENLMA